MVQTFVGIDFTTVTIQCGFEQPQPSTFSVVKIGSHFSCGSGKFPKVWCVTCFIVPPVHQTNWTPADVHVEFATFENVHSFLINAGLTANLSSTARPFCLVYEKIVMWSWVQFLTNIHMKSLPAMLVSIFNDQPTVLEIFGSNTNNCVSTKKFTFCQNGKRD